MPRSSAAVLALGGGYCDVHGRPVAAALALLSLGWSNHLARASEETDCPHSEEHAANLWLCVKSHEIAPKALPGLAAGAPNRLAPVPAAGAAGRLRPGWLSQEVTCTDGFAMHAAL